MIEKFKLFETKVDKIIGTNISYWGWEDDADTITAYILLDNESLYLKIHKIHTKHGLGAGKFEKTLELIKIGTLYKADLKLVRSLLKKYAHQKSRASYGFSTFWEDEEGNKMNLTDLIKLNKPEKTRRKLKYIKDVSDFKEPKRIKDIELVQYSERSYALFGEGTRDIKDKLVKLNCIYNRSLTDPSTGKKRAGWICSIRKLDKIKKLL